MTQAMPSGYLARETTVSAVINAAISGGIYTALFHDVHNVPVWGLGQLVFNFIPQSFMVALMGALVPGLVARRRVASVKEAPPSVAQVVSLAVFCALCCVVVGAGAIALTFAGLRFASVSFATGLLLNIAYGIALSLIVTPLTLRRIWS